jgi:hypothetical protein
LPFLNILYSFITRPREVDFVKVKTTFFFLLLLIKRTCFFSLFKAIFDFIRVLFYISKDFKALDFSTFFFFYTYNYAFSLILTLLIFSSLTTACNAFATFLALVLAFFLVYITFLVLIRVCFNFLNVFFFLAN